MAETASDYLTADIALHCERLREEAEKKAAEITKDMKGDIEQHTPSPYPYRKKHMGGGWKTSVKGFGNKGYGSYVSYGVYNKNVPQLIHLVEKGHKIVAHKKRITLHNFSVTDTADTSGRVEGLHFMEDARNKAAEKLNKEIEKLVEDFNNGKQ